MIRLKELFRLENLKRLRLIAGQDGLERTVTAAVLLEYDSSRMELPDFYRGDLVVTTLAYARGDHTLVANSLLALMNQGIAGLLVKTAYFSELPQSVVSAANKLGIPLFLFDETYIEEVILEVTELIRGKRHLAGYEQELDALMRGTLTADQVKEKVQRIDPTGAKAYRVCALYPREIWSVMESLPETRFIRPPKSSLTVTFIPVFFSERIAVRRFLKDSSPPAFTTAPIAAPSVFSI